MLFKRRIKKEKKEKKEKENGCRNTHLFDCLEAGNLTVCCIGGKQRAKKGKRGEGEEHYRIQGKQME